MEKNALLTQTTSIVQDVVGKTSSKWGLVDMISDLPSPSSGIWWPRAVLHQVSFTFCHLVFSYWRGKSYIHCNAGDMSSWKLSNLCKFKFCCFGCCAYCFMLFLLFCLQYNTWMTTTTTTTTKWYSNNNKNKNIKSCKLIFLFVFYLLFL